MPTRAVRSLSTAADGGAFVSKHYRPPSDEVEAFFRSQRILCRRSGDFLQTRECIFCEKPHRNDPSNLFKLAVHRVTGTFSCFRCGRKGKWHELKQAYLPNSPRPRALRSELPQAGYPTGYEQESGQRMVPVPDSAAVRDAALMLYTPIAKPVRDYLTQIRGLNPAVITRYGVGVKECDFPSAKGWETELCMTFPWIMREKDWHAICAGLAPASAAKTSMARDKRRSNVEILEENTALMRAEEAEERDGESDDDEAAEAGADKSHMANATAEEGVADAPDDQSNAADASAAPPPKDVEALGDRWQTVRHKLRSLRTKGNQRLEPKGGGFGLFGWHTVPDAATAIVLTEGEFDAMAVHEATGLPAVSLPSGCQHLPPQVLPLLERFERIYLWTDFDVAGREAALKFLRKLGEQRCVIVNPLEDADGAKDANDVLRKGGDMMEYLRRAKVPRHEDVAQVQDYRDEVLELVRNPGAFRGAQVRSLPLLTKILKGFRRGEMTVFSGPTGAGKTTLLSQVSLDLAGAGGNVLWGSFEIKNTQLIKKMLQQFGGCNEAVLGKLSASRLEALIDKFADLPLFFLRFHGGTILAEVLEAMRYSVYAEDVDHVILDNLQFMMEEGPGRNRFDIQDAAISAFRRFATEHNVHVTLVIHPRKESEGNRLGMNSVFGTAKATQEADNVLLLQMDGLGQKSLDVKKNRYDGALGKVRLSYDENSDIFLEEEA